MSYAVSGAKWVGILLALLAGPVLVIFSVPFAIGIGSDVWHSVGPAPLALAALGGAVLMLGRRAARRAPI